MPTLAILLSKTRNKHQHPIKINPLFGLKRQGYCRNNALVLTKKELHEKQTKNHRINYTYAKTYCYAFLKQHVWVHSQQFQFCNSYPLVVISLFCHSALMLFAQYFKLSPPVLLPAVRVVGTVGVGVWCNRCGFAVPLCYQPVLGYALAYQICHYCCRPSL